MQETSTLDHSSTNLRDQSQRDYSSTGGNNVDIPRDSVVHEGNRNTAFADEQNNKNLCASALEYSVGDKSIHTCTLHIVNHSIFILQIVSTRRINTF